MTEEVLRPRIRGSDIWKRIKGNQDERYHRFEAMTPADDLMQEGVDPLVVDFKRVFSFPTQELYYRLSHGVRRRGVLKSPFLHHFSSRFAYYCLRVALPEPTVRALLPVQEVPLAQVAIPA
jgi:hypothetical protein